MGKAELNIMVKILMNKYNLGLVRNHYFINDYTELISYCLENYGEIKDLKESSTICRKKKSFMNDIKQARDLLLLFSCSKY